MIKVYFKMTLGTKGILTFRNNLLKICLKVLLHALFVSHFEYCDLLVTDITSALLLFLEKQLNWALKTVFYRSRNKCSTPLRISEGIIGMGQRNDLISFEFWFSILKNEKKAFQNHPKLPTVSFRMNDQKKLYRKSLIEVSYFMDPSFKPVWEIEIRYPLN